MNIFHKVALQGLRKNRTRTFVTVIGVILSATLFTAVATFGTSLLQYLINCSIAKSGNWHIAFVDVDSDFVRERMEDSQVTDTVAFENIGYALLDGIKSTEKPYLFLAGFTDEAFGKLPIALISGRLPQNDTEIIIPNHVSIKAGVRIPAGEPLSLAVGNRETDGNILTQHDPYKENETLHTVEDKTYTVVGTYERAGFEEHDSPGYTLITKSNAAETSGRYSLFLTLDSPQKVNEYGSRFADSTPFVLNEDILRFYGVSENTLFNAVMFSVGGILAAIIMLGSVFLIYNSFHISLNERIHQFGILMSVGATARQLKSSVLFEGLCIGVLGIPFGVAAGIGSVALALPVVEKNFAVISARSVPLRLSVSVPALAAAVAVSLVTILISAYIPARKAAAVPVMDCIRQTGEIKTEAKDVKISKVSERVYGLEGLLALKNFRRNKRRYRSVVLSLMLSVVLFVTGSAFGSTLKGIAKEITVEIDGDISFYAEEMPQDELLALYDRLKDVDGVSKSTWQTNLLYAGMVEELPGDFAGGQFRAADELPIYAQFIEDAIYYEFIESLGFSREVYSGRDAKVLALIMDTSEHKVFFTGQEMEFTLYSSAGNRTKTVCTTMVDNYPLDMLPFDSTPQYVFLMVAPWSMHADFGGLEETFKAGLTFWADTPAQTMAKLQSEITDSGINCDYTLANLSSAVDLFRSATFVVDVFTYTFGVMISLIGVANVFNTISTNIRIRRRELAMLRSVGMSERGFNRMMNFECFFYGLRTLLFGVPVSGLLSWLIYKGMVTSEQLEGFAYHFPWKSMAVSVLGVFCIVFITMLYATGKIRKENIIDALRDEMS
ncbi:MAG: ABC transporter permease [Lachnospiraceae bacterium]|nr:ABC transporter permease [Lachnospiraceae bacterium]